MSKRTPSPKRGASFVSAVISAIKNAAAQTAIRANSIAAVGYTDSKYYYSPWKLNRLDLAILLNETRS